MARKRITVVNEWDYEIDYDAAVNIMDDEVREQVHMNFDFTDEPDEVLAQRFFDQYAKAHEEKFGEPWVLTWSNPVW